MNKKDLINAVSDELGITKKETGIVIGAVMDAIKDGLAEDGKVTLVGFGTWRVAKQAARKARNPRTGEAIDVPEKSVPKFKPSAAMKEAVAGFVFDEPDTEDEAEAEAETEE